LRLCVQKLCKHLGEKGKNIDGRVSQKGPESFWKRILRARRRFRLTSEFVVRIGMNKPPNFGSGRAPGQRPSANGCYEPENIRRNASPENQKCRANAQMSHGLLRTHCKLDSEGRELLRRAMEELHLSARAYDRILEVGRTIADLAGSGGIRPPHVGREEISTLALRLGLFLLPQRGRNLSIFLESSKCLRHTEVIQQRI
jgi:hypothetical protein